MTETLLFLHVLSAAALFVALAAFSAVALGARLEPAAANLFHGAWYAGATGVLVFGIWLALRIDGYEVWDAWILIALGLWMAAGRTGDMLPLAYKRGEGAAENARYHWLTVALVVLLLADMVWKPWA